MCAVQQELSEPATPKHQHPCGPKTRRRVDGERLGLGVSSWTQTLLVIGDVTPGTLRNLRDF